MIDKKTVDNATEVATDIALEAALMVLFEQLLTNSVEPDSDYFVVDWEELYSDD